MLVILEVNILEKCAYNNIRQDHNFSPFSPLIPPENPLKGESETKIYQFDIGHIWTFISMCLEVILKDLKKNDF